MVDIRERDVKDVLQIVVLALTVMGAIFVAWGRISRIPTLDLKMQDHEKRLSIVETKLDGIDVGVRELVRHARRRTPAPLGDNDAE